MSCSREGTNGTRLPKRINKGEVSAHELCVLDGKLYKTLSWRGMTRKNNKQVLTTSRTERKGKTGGSR